MSTTRSMPACSAREATPSASSRATAAMSAVCRSAPGSSASRRESCSRLSERFAKPAGLGERQVDEAALVVALRFALGELEVGLQRRERRADLVRGVGDEAAQGGDGGLDARRHAVEGLAEAPDLVASGDGCAGAEVAGRHAVARLRERDDRPRDARRHQVAGEGREPDGERGRQDPGHGRAHQCVAAGRRALRELHVGAVAHVHGEGTAGARAAAAAEQPVAQRVRQPVVVAAVTSPPPRPSSVSASSVLGGPESTTSVPLCEYTCTRVCVVSAAAWAHEVRSCTVVSGGGSATTSLALARRYWSSALRVVVGEHADEDAAEDHGGEQRHARVGQREPPSQRARPHRRAQVASRYPIPGTVRITLGLLGSCSIFSRRRRTWTLTVLSS